MLQRHLQDTYDYLFEAAHRALMDGGSFAPFGAATRKSGELIHTNVGLDMDKSVPSDHISGLIAGFRKEEADNGLIAAGLAFDGRASSDDAAALCFHIEAANGAALEIIVPYERAPANVIQFFEPKISPVQPEIFTEVM